MDKRLVAALAFVAVSGLANAATDVCTGTAGSGATVTGVTDGTAFVRVDLVPKCSANVQLNFEQEATSAAACGNSKKGKNTFGGSTGSSGIIAPVPCAITSGACAASGASVTNGVVTCS